MTLNFLIAISLCVSTPVLNEACSPERTADRHAHAGLIRRGVAVARRYARSIE
ncbi:hypothetical protein LG3211_2556 [Lysobacter gummosus]|nr:hypothetical protein LG3211_2556 [Lysobacter gummosus]